MRLVRAEAAHLSLLTCTFLLLLTNTLFQLDRLNRRAPLYYFVSSYDHCTSYRIDKGAHLPAREMPMSHDPRHDGPDFRRTSQCGGAAIHNR